MVTSRRPGKAVLRHVHRTTRNKDEGQGTPQGAPLSPLLANWYMRRFVLGCLGTHLSRKNVQKFCESLSECAGRNTTHREPWEIVEALNRQLRGWANYFHLGMVSPAYRCVDNHVTRRLRQWLCTKHKEPSRGVARFPDAYLYETLGLIKLRARATTSRVRTA